MYIKSVHFQILSHLGKHYVMATTSSYFIVDLSVRLFYFCVQMGSWSLFSKRVLPPQPGLYIRGRLPFASL